MKEPPRQVQLVGRDQLNVPVQKPPALEPQQSQVEPNPVETLDIPVRPLASSLESVPGVLEAPVGPPTISQGPGSDGGGGTGRRGGIGPDDGHGLGPGTIGGAGGGPQRPGNGVTHPILVREVKPSYTSDAMRLRIQGAVYLECVVNPDGSVGDIKVIRSLDSTFGLDLEAIKAARQWRFRPGTRRGQAVPVLVTLELDFTIR